MGELIYVKDTKYLNVCDICGKKIPVHSTSFWDKENGKNYHEACKIDTSPRANVGNDDSKSKPKSQNDATEKKPQTFPSTVADISRPVSISNKEIDAIFEEATNRYADGVLAAAYAMARIQQQDQIFQLRKMKYNQEVWR